MCPSEQRIQASASGLAAGFAPGRASLIVYLMAGYPDRETSLASMRAAAAAGADIIEVGVPYSDPLADGPVIQRAGALASAAPGGFGLTESIDLAREFLADPGVEHVPPLVLMTYLNPVLRLGMAPTAARSAEAGISGFIIPDMPPDSRFAAEWAGAAKGAGLDSVFLVAPTSTDERLRLVAEHTDGFIYCVSTTGITGERAELPAELPGLVRRVGDARVAAGCPGLPVAVGFGIGTPEQVAAVTQLADGVVVGSAAVRRQDDPARLGGFVAELAEAVHGDA